MKKLLLMTILFSVPAVGMEQMTMKQFLNMFNDHPQELEQALTMLETMPISQEQAQQFLGEAMMFDNPTIAQFALRKGADIHQRDERGWMPLHSAAFSQHTRMVQFLLNNGALADINVQTRDKYGRTPLHMVAVNDNPDIARLLLDNGADVTIKDTWNGGNTPLEYARNREGENSEIYKLLREEWRKRFESKIKAAETAK